MAGVDEVGRGPLAGPVVAGAVILPPNTNLPWLSSVRDSKDLTPAAREKLSPLIYRDSLAVGIGAVPHDVIDTIGIAEATRRAMLIAIAELSCSPDQLLIDAISLPKIALPQRSIIRGDSISLSIACASIIAKVFRDHLMCEHDRRFHGYSFARNKGYATSQHLAALKRLGPCPIHRRSFAPVRLTELPK